ncbi:SGNH/GDSL hydrolase family protein [Xanthocytophaga agilis]|nr:SGNH/GDSL hydrolase family protein [Xanthocytophaga agilis]
MLTVVSTFVACLSCQQPPNSQSSIMQQPPSSIQISFLSLGDSYTIGESVAEKERWSVQLSEMLRQKGVLVSKPDIIAKTGWTTEELADAIAKSGNTKTYDLVSLLIGVNNQYRGQSTERYRKELSELLKTSIHYAKGNPKHVFVLSIPDWGVTPAGESRDRQQVAKEINAFNAVCQEECKKAGIVFFDITPLSRTAATDKNLIASDQLHFSGKMYQQWATHVLEGVIELIK